MDTPEQNQKKKSDPHKNRVSQKHYRQRKYAAFDGMEEVRAHHRQRYYERMAHMTKKSKEGMRRYHAMSKEQRNEVKRKNLILEKVWIQRMKDEGTIEAYRERLNARRREQVAAKKGALGVEGWKALQKEKYIKRTESQYRQRWQWLDEHLARPIPLPWLPLDWAESEPEEEEDTVQTIRTNALEQLNYYL